MLVQQSDFKILGADSGNDTIVLYTDSPAMSAFVHIFESGAGFYLNCVGQCDGEP